MRLLSPRQDTLSIFSNNSQLLFCLRLKELGWKARDAGGAQAGWLLSLGHSEGAVVDKDRSNALIFHQFSL